MVAATAAGARDEHLATVTRYMLDMIEINWRNGGK